MSDLTPDDGSSALRIASLTIYPIKSCAGIALDAVALAATGFALDRQWMVVDESGLFVSQRELPRMALITPRIEADQLVLSAPGLPPLHLPLHRPPQTPLQSPLPTPLAPEPGAERLSVQVWDDALPAWACGRLADAWFSTALGQPLRLVRFDATQRRLSSAAWTGELAAPNLFSDGYPILVLSTASLADLNRRLAAAGEAPVEMARFRPNLVIDFAGELGGDRAGGPGAEDTLDEIQFGRGDSAVTLRLVKPCARCQMPNIDPASAAPGAEPGRTLAGYRADARLGGAISFGVNAVITGGVGQVLHVGQAGRGTVRF